LFLFDLRTEMRLSFGCQGLDRKNREPGSGAEDNNCVNSKRHRHNGRPVRKVHNNLSKPLRKTCLVQNIKSR